MQSNLLIWLKKLIREARMEIWILTTPFKLCTPVRFILVTKRTMGGCSGYLCPHSIFRLYILPSKAVCNYGRDVSSTQSIRVKETWCMPFIHSLTFFNPLNTLIKLDSSSRPCWNRGWWKFIDAFPLFFLKL